ncbi:MAG: CsbD family protein [Leptolyngbyaceae cyanobacterium HOT.MB2.61]|nr:CsbD family protein [Leptolyngbyaceae cyanobacterium HOT.MB2.61]
MSIENRVEATAKNIEGKVQEAVGEVTGDLKMKAEGKAKQQEASARHAVEDIKDAAKDVIDKA